VSNDYLGTPKYFSSVTTLDATASKGGPQTATRPSTAGNRRSGGAWFRSPAARDPRRRIYIYRNEAAQRQRFLQQSQWLKRPRYRTNTFLAEPGLAALHSRLWKPRDKSKLFGFDNVEQANISSRFGTSYTMPARSNARAISQTLGRERQ